MAKKEEVKEVKEVKNENQIQRPAKVQSAK